MLPIPWLLFARKRLLIAAGLSVALACVLHMWVSADGWTDFGVFWHQFCGCPVDPTDAYVLQSWPAATASIVGIVLGFLPLAGAGGSTVPGGNLKALRRFFLTRPRSRLSVFVAPHLLAAVALAVLPSLGLVLLLGWLWMVQAPSLHHLMATLRVIPAVKLLPPHPGILQVLAVLDVPGRWVASFSVGLAVYAMFAAQQYLLLAENTWLKLAGAIPIYFFLYPLIKLFSPREVAMILLSCGRGETYDLPPSTVAIVLHFVFAAAVLYGCWRSVGEAEL